MKKIKDLKKKGVTLSPAFALLWHLSEAEQIPPSISEYGQTSLWNLWVSS